MLLTSGFTDAAQAADGRFDILRKPFELSALERAIEQAIGNVSGERPKTRAARVLSETRCGQAPERTIRLILSMV